MKNLFKKNLAGNQKPWMIALLAVAIVLIVLVLMDLSKKSDKPMSLVDEDNQMTITEEPVAIKYEELVEMSSEQKDQFKAEIPANMLVPEIDTELSEAEKKEIALPTVVVPAAPGSDSKFRSFNIVADNDTFAPTKVIANVGDTVHIDFTAVDKAYDIVFPSYNMMQTAKMGQTRILEFKAYQAGDFTYYCSACGGPESGPKGNIIIIP